MATRLLLGGLDKETTFVLFDVACDADLILGYECSLTLTKFFSARDVIVFRADVFALI